MKPSATIARCSSSEGWAKQSPTENAKQKEKRKRKVIYFMAYKCKKSFLNSWRQFISTPGKPERHNPPFEFNRLNSLLIFRFSGFGPGKPKIGINWKNRGVSLRLQVSCLLHL